MSVLAAITMAAEQEGIDPGRAHRLPSLEGFEYRHGVVQDRGVCRIRLQLCP
jgi:hypothetical protein